MQKYNVHVLEDASTQLVLVEEGRVMIDGIRYLVEEVWSHGGRKKWSVIMGLPAYLIQFCLDQEWVIKCDMVPPPASQWEQRLKALEADMRGTLITLEEARNNARDWERKYDTLRLTLINAL